MAVPYRFSAISNKILEEVLVHDFSKRQLKILLQIWRTTFGCHVYAAAYRPSDFKWCGIGRNVIDKELHELHEMNVIFLDKDAGLVGINPHAEKWICPKHNMGDFDEMRNEVLSKQLIGIPVLRIAAEELARESKVNPWLKEIIKKLNTGKLSRKKIREIADAYGGLNASATALAREKRIEEL